MKRAFSLVELVFSLLILGLIFSFSTLAFYQIYKNTQYEQELDFKDFRQNARVRDLSLEIVPLGNLLFKERFNAQFKGLEPASDTYAPYFKDKKSF